VFHVQRLLLILLVGTGLGRAQPRAVEPQTYAVICQFASVRLERFVDLEMQRARLESLALQNGLEQVFVRVPGPVSPVQGGQRPAADWPQTWSWNQLDPSGLRRDGGSPLLVRLFGESSFVLAPTTPLAPGEYALSYNNDNLVVYCFGVEP